MKHARFSRAAPLLLFLFAAPLFAAGTVTSTISRLGGTNNFVIEVTATGDAANGSFPAHTLATKGGGLASTEGFSIIAVVTDPGGTAPTDNWDLTITDSAGLDLLAGACADRDTSTTEKCSADPVPIRGATTLNITNNSVNAATITIRIYIVSSTVAKRGGTAVDGGGGGAPSGAAGGDLSGTYPDPSVAKVQGIAVDSAAPTADGSFWGWDDSSGEMVLYAFGAKFSLNGFEIDAADEDYGHVDTGTAVPGSCTNPNQMFWETDTKKLYWCDGDTYEAVVPDVSLATGTLPLANGGGLTTATDDTVRVGNGTILQEKTLPDCDDSGGNHLNYDTGTNAFSCGTSGGGSTVASPWFPFGPTGATTNFVNPSANRVYMYGLRVPVATSLRKATWYVSTGTASTGACGFAIYNSARTTKLHEFKGTCTSNGVAVSGDIGSSQTVAAGIYNIAYSSNDTTVSTAFLTTPSQWGLLYNTNDNLQTGFCANTADFSQAQGSVFPSACGALTEVSNGTTLPFVLLEP